MDKNREGQTALSLWDVKNDCGCFAFAGIWDRWKDGGGNPVETCSILTTTPNSLLAVVHDRMPVILERDDYELWLDPGFKDLSALAEMIRPFNAGLMKSYPVSTRVNAPKNDYPECAAAIALRRDQMSRAAPARNYSALA